MNLLKETKRELAEHGKTMADVLWCGTNKDWFGVSKFIELADVEYNDGFGTAEVAINLILVGNGFWLERSEYDGSEAWEYKAVTNKPTAEYNINALTISQFGVSAIGFDSLEYLNNIKDNEK